MGATLAKESATAATSTDLALQFLGHIREYSESGSIRETDFPVCCEFTEKYIVGAAQKNTFVFPNESEQANLKVCSEAFSALTTLLEYNFSLCSSPGFEDFAYKLMNALEMENSLLPNSEHVINNAKNFFKLVMNVIKQNGSSAQLKKRVEFLLGRYGMLATRVDDPLPAGAILNERGFNSGFKEGKTYLLKSLANTYLAADEKWAVHVHAGEYTISDAWTVNSFPERKGAIVIQSTHGTYLMTSSDGRIKCARVDKPRESELWWSDTTEDGFVYLRNVNKKYLATDKSDALILCDSIGGEQLRGYWGAVPCPQSVVLGAHDWEVLIIETPVWCDYCGEFIWGLDVKAHKCKKCGLCVHGKCKQGIGDNCKTSVELFGRDARKKPVEDPEVLAKQEQERLLIASVVCCGPTQTEEEAEKAALMEELEFQELRLLARTAGRGYNPFHVSEISTVGGDVLRESGEDQDEIMIEPIHEKETNDEPLTDLVEIEPIAVKEKPAPSPSPVKKLEVEKSPSPVKKPEVEKPPVKKPEVEKPARPPSPAKKPEAQKPARPPSPAKKPEAQKPARPPSPAKKPEAQKPAPKTTPATQEAAPKAKPVLARFNVEEKNAQKPVEKPATPASRPKGKPAVLARFNPEEKPPTAEPNRSAPKKLGNNAALMARFNTSTEAEKKPAPAPVSVPRKKSGNNDMKNKLEGLFGGGGIRPPGMRVPGAPGGGGASSDDDNGPDPAFAPPPELPHQEIEYAGELGIPISKEPRLQHLTRASGPARRRPPAAATN